MANVDAPVGMWPVKGTGGSTTPRMNRYQVVSGYTTRIGQGAPIALGATGVRLNDNGVAATVQSGGTVFLGVAANHWTSNSGTHDLWVFDDPEQVFLIQADDNSINVAHVVGLNVSLINATSSNSTTLRSIAEADGNTTNTAFGVRTTNAGHNRPLRIVGVSTNINKDELAVSWTGLLVKWNPAAHIHTKDTGVGV